MSDTGSGDLMATLKGILFGKAKDIRDPNIFHKLSLIAFFAWVGLGADGLSSANYGPEESFLSQGVHSHLGIFVALAMAITIIIIAYSQIVELFPGVEAAISLPGNCLRRPLAWSQDAPCSSTTWSR
jgi:hypothetical protein